MANKNFDNAKKAKADEFYTQREDIERELTHYSDCFKDKIVYCNCDDPTTSEFWRFFMRNFRPYGLKKLMATHYEPDEKNYAYKLEICEDTNGDGRVDWNDKPTKTQIPCNGDFRNATCIDLLKEADIVVTNPPFSLFSDYLAQLIEYRKNFIIIGDQNKITYKDIFALLKENKIWLGYYSGDMSFKVPDSYEERSTRYWVDESGQKWRSFGNMTWFTNIDIEKRHKILDLRGNYYYGNEKKYPAFENYDGINVDRVDDIPEDYFGVMGVPITFLNKHNPNQFEILGLGIVGSCEFSSNRRMEILDKKTGNGTGKFTFNAKGTLYRKYRPGIDKKGPAFKDVETGELYSSIYARILIRRVQHGNK